MSASLSKQAYPIIKTWPFRLGVGHGADKPILEKNDDVEKSKKGSQGETYWAVMLRRRQGLHLFSIHCQRPPCEMV